MMTKNSLFLIAVLFLTSCNSKDPSLASMCTQLSWENILETEIQLTDDLTDGYKVLIGDKALTTNCVESVPCIKKSEMENKVLKLTLAYPKTLSPGKIDFFLFDNTELVVNRIEKFDVHVKWDEAGLVKGSRECGVMKKAVLKLTVEGYSPN